MKTRVTARPLSFALACATAALAVGLAAAPAGAHFVEIHQGTDDAYISNNDHTVTVEDLENDGNEVIAEVRLTRTPWNDAVSDTYGGGSASRTYAGFIDSFRLCEVGSTGLSCTSWTKA